MLQRILLACLAFSTAFFIATTYWSSIYRFDYIGFLWDNPFDILGFLTILAGFIWAWFSFLRDRYRMLKGSSDYHIVSTTSIRDNKVYTCALEEAYLENVFKPIDKDVIECASRVREVFEEGTPKHLMNEILRFKKSEVQRSVNAIVGNRVCTIFGTEAVKDFLASPKMKRTERVVYAVLTNEVLPQFHYERVRTILFSSELLDLVLEKYNFVNENVTSKDQFKEFLKELQNQFNYFPKRFIDSNRIKLAVELLDLIEKRKNDSEEELKRNPPPFVKLYFFSPD